MINLGNGQVGVNPLSLLILFHFAFAAYHIFNIDSGTPPKPLLNIHLLVNICSMLPSKANNIDAQTMTRIIGAMPQLIFQTVRIPSRHDHFRSFTMLLL